MRGFSRPGLAAAGVLAASALALAACSSSSRRDGVPANIVLVGLLVQRGRGGAPDAITDWDNGMPAVVAQWNKEHPNIQVQLIKPSGTGYTLYDKLITDNSAGTNPDISEIEYQALPEIVANKVVVPLTIPAEPVVVVQLANHEPGELPGLDVRRAATSADGLLLPQGRVRQARPVRPDDVGAVRGRRGQDPQGQPEGCLGNFDAADPEWFHGLAQQAEPTGGRPAGPPGRWRSTTPPPGMAAQAWSTAASASRWSPSLTDMNRNIVGSVSASRRPTSSTIAGTAGKSGPHALPAWASDTSVGTSGAS